MDVMRQLSDTITVIPLILARCYITKKKNYVFEERSIPKDELFSPCFIVCVVQRSQTETALVGWDTDGESTVCAFAVYLWTFGLYCESWAQMLQLVNLRVYFLFSAVLNVLFLCLKKEFLDF